VKKEEANVGDWVSWTGWRHFGTIPKRCTGTIESLECGIPFYTDPPEYTTDGYHKEAGRHPAALIKPDRVLQPGEERPVIRFEDLTIIMNAKQQLGIQPAEYLRGNSPVEAIKWWGNNYSEVYNWVMKWDLADPGISLNEENELRVSVIRVEMLAKPGQWVVRDIANEFFYPCDDDTFTQIFEPTDVGKSK